MRREGVAPKRRREQTDGSVRGRCLLPLRLSGVRVLIVCGRDEPQSANAPNPEQIQAQLEEERVNKRARIYLRDLRRDAVIEYN